MTEYRVFFGNLAQGSMGTLVDIHAGSHSEAAENSRLVGRLRVWDRAQRGRIRAFDVTDGPAGRVATRAGDEHWGPFIPLKEKTCG